jgi:hypothetical protein
VGNEEKEYLVPDSNRTMINITNELTNIYKKSLKEEIMDELIEILMEKLQEMVKQNVQNEFKQHQDTTKKKKTRKDRETAK